MSRRPAERAVKPVREIIIVMGAEGRRRVMASPPNEFALVVGDIY